MLSLFLFYLLAFPAGMLFVEFRPPEGPAVCLFRLATGLDCPGCGMTRAFRAMGRLDVISAFRYNPLGPLVFIVALGFWAYVLGMLVTGGRINLPPWWVRNRGRLLAIGVIVYLLVGFVRIGYEIGHPPPPRQAPPFIFGS